MKKLILCLIILSSAFSYAADDSKLWFSLKHKNEIIDDFFIEFETDLRFDNEISSLYQILFDIGLRYEINKYFKVAGSYRTRGFEYDEFQNEILLKGYFEYDITENLEFDFRLRYNKRWREYDEDKEYIRPRFKLDYDLHKRLKPFLDIEGLYRINDNNPDRFDEVRYTIGVEFDLPAKVDFEIYYAYHDEMNKNNITDSHVLGIKWILNK